MTEEINMIATAARERVGVGWGEGVSITKRRRRNNGGRTKRTDEE